MFGIGKKDKDEEKQEDSGVTTQKTTDDSNYPEDRHTMEVEVANTSENSLKGGEIEAATPPPDEPAPLTYKHPVYALLVNF